MILSKINAKMLIICDSDISPEQIDEVQKHKTSSGKEALDSFNIKSESYKPLVEIEWE